MNNILPSVMIPSLLMLLTPLIISWNRAWKLTLFSTFPREGAPNQCLIAHSFSLQAREVFGTVMDSYQVFRTLAAIEHSAFPFNEINPIGILYPMPQSTVYDYI